MNRREKDALFFVYQDGQAILVRQDVWEERWLNWVNSIRPQNQKELPD